MSAPRRGAIQRFGRKVRWRVFWTLIAFGVGASLTWYFREAVFAFLIAPAGGQLSSYGGLPVYTNPTEMLGATIGLAMKGGMVTAFPVLVFSIFGLVSPALSRERRNFIRLFLPVMFLFYLGGAAFAYFVMLPAGMKFLLHFGDGIAVPLITISAYMSIVTALLFWLGVVFQIPLIMYLLAKMRLVSHIRLRKFRKYVPFAAFFLGAIVTPTFDAVNQTMVAVPIILLYEVGLLLAWLGRPRPADYRTRWQRIRAKWPLFVVLMVVAAGVGAYWYVSWYDFWISTADWHSFLSDVRWAISKIRF